MVQVLKGRVRDTSTTTGTGNITLANAPAQGYRSFASVMNVGDTIWAVIAAQTTGDWEEGLYTYSATNTLTRTTILDNSLGTTAAISFAAGTKDVFCVGPIAYTSFSPLTPGGRLSNAVNTPVLTTSFGGQTSVFYCPYINSLVPIFDGIGWRMMDFGTGLSQTLADTSKSPAASVANSIYDMFVWNDAGTLRCTRGIVWQNTGLRAASGLLSRQNGILVNSQAITNGPAALRGTYVGTIGTNAANTLDMNFGATAANGTAANIAVWNQYNRIVTKCQVSDNTASWTTPTATTWRAANGSNTNRVGYVCGNAEDGIKALYSCLAQISAGTFVPYPGIGIDSLTANSAFVVPGGTSGTSAFASPAAHFIGFMQQGSHFVQALEYVNASGGITWVGAGAAQTQGLIVELQC